MLALALARGWDSYRAGRQWHAAEDALHRYDLDAAAAALDRYIELRPRDPAGYFLAARTARRQGRFVEAGRYLGQSEQLGGPTDATRLEWDLILVQQGQLDGVDARLRATIGPDHPDAPLVLEAMARSYLDAGRFPDAQQACDLWRSRQPENPWPWLWSGWIAERHHYLHIAIGEYRRAVELAPDYVEARAALARVLLRQRQAAPAAEHYEWLLARNPDDPEALLGLAGCRVEQGRTGEAVPLLDRVLERNPFSYTGLYLRGKAALEQGDPVAAEDWLRRAVGEQPNEVEALHHLVSSLRAQRKDAEVDSLARRLDELRADLDRFEKALGMSSARPADAAPTREAGVIALRLGRTAEGLNLLRDSLRRKGDPRPTHAALAGYYRQAGDPARAAFHQRFADQP